MHVASLATSDAIALKEGNTAVLEQIIRLGLLERRAQNKPRHKINQTLKHQTL